MASEQEIREFNEQFDEDARALVENYPVRNSDGEIVGSRRLFCEWIASELEEMGFFEPYNQQIQRLETEISNLRAENLGKTKKIDELEDRVEESEDEINGLKVENNEFRRSFGSLVDDVNAGDAELNSRIDLILRVDQQYAMLTTLLGTLQDRIPAGGFIDTLPSLAPDPAPAPEPTPTPAPQAAAASNDLLARLAQGLPAAEPAPPVVAPAPPLAPPAPPASELVSNMTVDDFEAMTDKLCADLKSEFNFGTPGMITYVKKFDRNVTAEDFKEGARFYWGVKSYKNLLFKEAGVKGSNVTAAQENKAHSLAQDFYNNNIEWDKASEKFRNFLAAQPTPTAPALVAPAAPKPPAPPANMPAGITGDKWGKAQTDLEAAATRLGLDKPELKAAKQAFLATAIPQLAITVGTPDYDRCLGEYEDTMRNFQGGNN